LSSELIFPCSRRNGENGISSERKVYLESSSEKGGKGKKVNAEGENLPVKLPAASWGESYEERLKVSLVLGGRSKRC